MDQGNPNTRDVQRDLLQRTTNVLRTVLSELESPVSAPSPSSASAQSSLPAKRVKQFQVSLSFFEKVICNPFQSSPTFTILAIFAFILASLVFRIFSAINSVNDALLS